MRWRGSNLPPVLKAKAPGERFTVSSGSKLKWLAILEAAMTFKVTILTPIDQVVFARGTARQALDTTHELHSAGIQRVVITDDDGERVTEEQLNRLSQCEPGKTN